MRIFLIVGILCISCSIYAQRNKLKKVDQYGYLEYQFSGSDTYQDGKSVSDKIRFAPLLNAGHEININFSKTVGIYTGLGIRNVGYIDRPNYTAPGTTSETELKMKHRVYALLLPLGIKLGNMGSNTYVSVGGELNLFFNYKEKVWVDGSKTKKSEWFSDRVELLNPSFFLQFSAKNVFIKFILYPNNFIKESNTTFAGNLNIYQYPSSSANIFMVTLGYRFKEMALPIKVDGRAVMIRL